MSSLSSWGNLPYAETYSDELSSTTFENFLATKTGSSFIAAGAGRSYGDVGLNPGGLAFSTTHMNKYLSFDPISGILECESGVLIRDIQATFAKRGWISPVTPGTSFVSVGGAVANDVHGKNHHSKGSFGNHVLEFVLARSDGQVLVCSDKSNKDLFSATIGGLGLTGVILRVKLQLAPVPSPWVLAEKIPFRNLEGFFELSVESEAAYDSSVAWFDCSTAKAGRGSFIRGRHVASSNPSSSMPKSFMNIPFTPPVSLINKVTLRPLNTMYFHLQAASASQRVQNMWSFYYPLDAIQNWNRAYGRRGFYQYQSVVPTRDAAAVTAEMVAQISRSGMGSFLAVLKTFGAKPSKGMLSFPMEGTTLALDFPNVGQKTEKLFQALDDLVSEAGGRLNPAKDARMSDEMFRAGFPRHHEFSLLRDKGISSGFSRRIFGS